ncbi:oligosaccharide flippase family protein [Mucisphaera calidilacus]|uniref:Lipopolysaccharide biosynthesis protein WzxC n=1 Tax=Mucisphaera calidilacus TaxID=2527982 RepID=A0A518BTL2_9BACT|nr:oligosaccharide flippase family protein [Mucisphaera calidilacus]QDU70306.1 Lipopolysaccharide biosynthesis protein WzxC [Mucisphaera calidilacus]
MTDQPAQPGLDAADPSWSRRFKDRVTALPGLDHFKGGGLKAMALKGSVWTMAGFGASQIIRLASNLILTRLLFPEAFGLMALVTVFMTGLQMFSDVGIAPAIIQNPRGDDPKFLNTAWTIQVIRGFILWAFAFAIAYPVASFYEQPLLAQMIPAVGITAAINGFQSTAIHTASRHLMLARVTLVQLISQVLGITVMVAWAWTYPTVWALVAGGITTAVANTALSFALLPAHPHRFAIERESLKALTSFGKWIFISTLFGYFVSHGDKLILGIYLSTADLGVYSIASQLAILVWMVNAKIVERVLYPAYAKLQHVSIAELRERVYRIRKSVAMTLYPVGLLLIIFAQPIITFLYDDRYQHAGWMLQILAVGHTLTTSTNVGPFYLAWGKSQVFAGLVIVRGIMLLSAMMIGGYVAGGEGVIVGVAAVPLIYYPVQVAIYARYGLWIWRFDLVMILGITLALTLGWVLFP